MDPYIVIPEDYEDAVRKRIRERDEEEEKAPNKGARIPSSTSTSSSSTSLSAPKPEESLGEYSQQRLEEGLQYVLNAAKRDVTPRTRVFLKLHQEAYEKALSEPPKNPAAVAVVQALDQVYYSEAFYFRPRQGKDYDQLQAFVKLRELELLANYGDYLGQERQEIRAELKDLAKRGTEDVKSANTALGPPFKWVDIADALVANNPPEISSHIRIASGVLGIDAEHMSWLIKEWGTRNRLLHNSIRVYIEDCNWDDLKSQLCRDLKELLMVTDGITATKYQRVLLSLAHKYFEIDDFDDPGAWYPSERSRELKRALKERKDKGKKKNE